MKAADELCTFVLGDLTFGVEVNQIREVLRQQVMTPVPLAPPVVAGLINLRGQIVTALDLRQRLALGPAQAGAAQLNVVVRTGADVVSLIVDDVGDVVEVDAEQVEAPPTTMRGAVKELVHGVFKHERGLVLLLDVKRAVAVPDDGEVEAA